MATTHLYWIIRPNTRTRSWCSSFTVGAGASTLTGVDGIQDPSAEPSSGAAARSRGPDLLGGDDLPALHVQQVGEREVDEVGGRAGHRRSGDEVEQRVAADLVALLGARIGDGGAAGTEEHRHRARRRL